MLTTVRSCLLSFWKYDFVKGFHRYTSRLFPQDIKIRWLLAYVSLTTPGAAGDRPLGASHLRRGLQCWRRGDTGSTCREALAVSPSSLEAATAKQPQGASSAVPVQCSSAQAVSTNSHPPPSAQYTHFRTKWGSGGGGGTGCARKKKGEDRPGREREGTRR